MADVSKEELLHIAKLADLNIKEDELDNYLAKLTRHTKLCRIQ